VGSVRAQSVRLVPIDAHFRSGFRGTFYGDITSTSNGCELHGRIEFPRALRTFMTIWLSLAVLLLFVSILDPQAVSANAPPWLFPVIGIAFERFGLWAAHRSASRLTLWLEDRLQAAPLGSLRNSLLSP
jgi:hypothetical protein